MLVKSAGMCTSNYTTYTFVLPDQLSSSCQISFFNFTVTYWIKQGFPTDATGTRSAFCSFWPTRRAAHPTNAPGRLAGNAATVVDLVGCHIPTFTNEQSRHYRMLQQKLETDSSAIGQPMTSKGLGSCDKFANALQCKDTDHVAVFSCPAVPVDRGVGASRGNTKPYGWKACC